MPVSQNTVGDPRNLDDEGLNMNTEQQMGKLRQKFKEPDLWPQTVSKHVKQRQSDVVTNLAKVKDDIRADRAQFEQGFLRLAHSALAGLGEEPHGPSSTTQPPHPIQFLGPEGQPFCNGLVDLLKQADAVIYVYDQLAKRTPQPPPVQDIRASFVGEKEIAATTIQAGKHVVETEVDKLLAGGLHNVRNGSNTLTTEEEQRGKLLLARGIGQGIPGKQTRGWGKVARDTERAMQKLCFPKT